MNRVVSRRKFLDTTTAIIGGQVLAPEEIIPDGTVLYDGGRIVAVGGRHDISLPSGQGIEVVDARGMLVLPGFIDQHVHGGGNADTMDNSYEALCTMAKTFAKFGTTAMCPTTVAASEEDLMGTLATIGETAKRGCPDGARVLGAHIEGPFMNPEARGAHEMQFMVSPSIDRLRRYHDAAGGKIRIFTMSPELPGITEVIETATRMGILVSIGHTKASLEQTLEAIEAGARCVTHFYNAMAPFHHRQPGILGAVAADDRVMVELIADGTLVHPIALEIVLRIVGSKRAILITDCLRAADAPRVERFSFSGNTLCVGESNCFLANGTIWGSLLTINRAVPNIQRILGRSLSDAVNMASLNPATVLNIADKKGSLEPGKDADIIIVDSDMNVHRTIVEGNTVHVS